MHIMDMFHDTFERYLPLITFGSSQNTLINNQFNGKGKSEPNMTQSCVVSVRLKLNIDTKLC